MRRAMIAMAVTTGLVAAATRRPRKARPAAVRATPVIPAPRLRTGLEQFVEGDGELVEADQDAQDAHILAALDQLLGRAG